MGVGRLSGNVAKVDLSAAEPVGDGMEVAGSGGVGDE